jgi:hypothetical protein
LTLGIDDMCSDRADWRLESIVESTEPLDMTHAPRGKNTLRRIIAIDSETTGSSVGISFVDDRYRFKYFYITIERSRQPSFLGSLLDTVVGDDRNRRQDCYDDDHY